MRIRLLFTITIVSLLLASCLYSERVHGSGNPVTYKENFTNFTKLALTNAIEAEIEYSDNYEVVVSIDDNLKDYVEIYQRGDELMVGLQSDVSYSDVNFKIRITMPKLEVLDASGATDIVISGFNNNETMKFDLSGASELDGFLTVKNLVFDVSGASEVEMRGSAKNLYIDGSGASEMDFNDFRVDDAEVQLSGASDMILTVEENLSASLSGASDLKYYGHPQIRHISTSGASDIRNLD